MASPYFNINDLRGGINDSDSPFSLPANQVTIAQNVDFREGMIASKRKGMTPFSMANSVFERDLPLLQTSNQGGFTAAAAGALAVTAGTDEDGTGNTNHILVARIVTKNATDVTAVDYGGVALTMVGESSNANAGRLEVWRLHNPSLIAANLNVTLAGAADCSIIVERWSRVDVAAGIQNFAIANSTSSFTVPVNANWNPQFMAQIAVAWRNTGTATNQGAVWNYNSIQQANGNARVLAASAVGMKPNTGFAVIFGVFDDLVTATWAWRGRLATVALTNIRITALMRHSPSNLVSADELWAQDNYGRLDRYLQTGGWQTGVAMAFYGSGSAFTSGFNGTNGVSLHGKFFLALDGTLAGDTLQVWDGTQLRFAGCTTPGITSFVNTAAGGAFTGTRYYRCRAAEYQGSTCVRRSEPGPVQTFAPSGVNTGAQWTTAAVTTGQYLTGYNAETHYEIEASVDNVLFYRIATHAIVAGATTTDTAVYAATATYTAFPLSENIGEYARPIAARHVVVDEDRLLVGGSVFSQGVLDSRVSWTVLRADTGVGNDERVPVAQRHYTDFDGLSGGRITHLIAGISGSIYAFKQQRIYKMIRTGTVARAYDTLSESESRGCVLRGATLGTDENGVPCVYFTDPNVGVCRFASRGVEDLMQTRRVISQRINKGASTTARCLFYPKFWLVWVWLTLDSATSPSYCCCFNIRTRSWTDYSGRMATVMASTLFPNTSAELRPYVSSTSVSTGTSLITEGDAGVNDDSTRFRGYITTRPYQLGALYRKFGVVAAILLAKAGAGVTAGLGLIRSYGKERKDVTGSLAPAGTETNVIVPMDDAKMSECFFVQFELGDPLAFAGAQLDQTWTLDELAVKVREEEEGTS